MIRINLLPVRAVQKKEKLRGQIILLIFILGLTVLGCAGVYSSMLLRLSDINGEIRKNEEEINRLKQAIGEVAHFKKLQEELRGKLDVLDKLKAGKTGPVHLLDELSKATPDKLWLDSLKEKAGSITITGVGLNEETVAEFMQRLEESPYFQGVELQVTEQANLKGRKLQKFALACRTESPGAGAPKAPSAVSPKKP